jgi:hypothetical protein
MSSEQSRLLAEARNRIKISILVNHQSEMKVRRTALRISQSSLLLRRSFVRTLKTALSAISSAQNTPRQDSESSLTAASSAGDIKKAS